MIFLSIYIPQANQIQSCSLEHQGNSAWADFFYGKARYLSSTSVRLIGRIFVALISYVPYVLTHFDNAVSAVEI
jgi:hypothetical protein